MAQALRKLKALALLPPAKPLILTVPNLIAQKALSLHLTWMDLEPAAAVPCYSCRLAQTMKELFQTSAASLPSLQREPWQNIPLVVTVSNFSGRTKTLVIFKAVILTPVCNPLCPISRTEKLAVTFLLGFSKWML